MQKTTLASAFAQISPFLISGADIIVLWRSPITASHLDIWSYFIWLYHMREVRVMLATPMDNSLVHIMPHIYNKAFAIRLIWLAMSCALDINDELSKLRSNKNVIFWYHLLSVILIFTVSSSSSVCLSVYGIPHICFARCMQRAKEGISRKMFALPFISDLTHHSLCA